VFLWPKVVRVREENEGISLLQNVIIAICTYDRAAPSIIIQTHNSVPHGDDNDSSNRQDVSGSERTGLTSRQRLSEFDGLSDSEKSGLNTSCQSLRDSDLISFSESEKNCRNTSCQSLRDIDGISVSESETSSV